MCRRGGPAARQPADRPRLSDAASNRAHPARHRGGSPRLCLRSENDRDHRQIPLWLPVRHYRRRGRVAVEQRRVVFGPRDGEPAGTDRASGRHRPAGSGKRIREGHPVAGGRQSIRADGIWPEQGGVHHAGGRPHHLPGICHRVQSARRGQSAAELRAVEDRQRDG